MECMQPVLRLVMSNIDVEKLDSHDQLTPSHFLRKHFQWQSYLTGCSLQGA